MTHAQLLIITFYTHTFLQDISTITIPSPITITITITMHASRTAKEIKRFH